MIIMRKVKLSYLFSLVTAILYGFLLDGGMALVSLIPVDLVVIRILLYVSGMLLCSTGIALLFHTYISSEAYELFVKELSTKFHVDIHKFKTIYNCSSCIIAILLSFLFFGFGHFEGIKFCTVLCALLNGTLIKLASKLLEKIWVFRDAFSLKKYF